MKRLFVIAILVLSLVACSTKPKYMHGSTYNIAQEAVLWCNRYEQGKITQDDLRQEMERLIGELDEVDAKVEGLEAAENTAMKGTLRSIASVTYKGDTAFYKGFDELKEKLKK